MSSTPTSHLQTPKMTPTSSETSPQNLFGAVIFTVYVILALVLTALIAYHLATTYHSLPPTYLSQKLGRSTISTHVYTFVSLAILSFSVLSYHMLSFLIISYNYWAEERGIAVPSSVFGRGGVLGRGRTEVFVWEWLMTSTLFLDFAREICATWGRYWWTGQALWATVGVYGFVASHGMPNLSRYFQIFSFSNNINSCVPRFSTFTYNIRSILPIEC